MGHLAIVVDAVANLNMEESRPIIYDRPVQLRLLYQDPLTGAEHYVVRYPAGLQVLRHRHRAAHTIIVLEGRLIANGKIVGPGSYCHFPAGEPMHHAPTDTSDCVFVTIFDGPFDVEPLKTGEQAFDGPATHKRSGP